MGRPPFEKSIAQKKSGGKAGGKGGKMAEIWRGKDFILVWNSENVKEGEITVAIGEKVRYSRLIFFKEGARSWEPLFAVAAGKARHLPSEYPSAPIRAIPSPRTGP
jgi:hypothetical protein